MQQRISRFCSRKVFEKCESMKTQQSFQRQSLGHRDLELDKKKIVCNWVSNFRQSSSASSRKNPERPRTSRGSENAAAVKCVEWSLTYVSHESMRLFYKCTIEASTKFYSNH
ncbi:hypothetical protein NPIL_67911 [Nephila pilipes]|uniref:Uncharacterized protein n=1 Tax=Nephila pilipes TaxID=299642 RepID=A0A8X6TXD5_NEPPI|nr:hypothetical protein NPIL_67911 [Nephila pilipes]